MAYETTIRSKIGTFAFDPSKLSDADRTRLEKATGPDGSVAPDVLIEVRNDNPNVFKQVTKSGLPLPSGKTDTPPYGRISDDVAALMLRFGHMAAESASDTREALNDSYIAQSEQFMDAAGQERNLAVRAAEAEKTAKITETAVGLAGTAIGGATAANGFRGLAKSASSTSKVGDLNSEIKTHRAEKSALDDQFGRMQTKHAERSAAGQDVTHLEASMLRNRRNVSKVQDNIETKGAEAHHAESTSRELTEAVRAQNMAGGAADNLFKNAGGAGAAGGHFDAAILNADAKLTDAEQQNAATNRDKNASDMQAQLEFAKEVIRGASEAAQSGISATKAMAQNMGA